MKGYLGLPGNVYGGPFPAATAWAKTRDKSLRIKLDPRTKAQHDIDLPIRDFALPDDEKQVLRALRKAFSTLSKGGDVYIGCTAGYGRTGTIMASLVSVARPDVDPVEFVRTYYDGHAVETEDQENYARTFAERHPWFAWWVRFWYVS